MATEIESLQLVAFVSGPPPAKAGSLWMRCLPDDPYETFLTLGPGHTSASGLVGEMRVEIQSQPNRIDFFLSGPSLPGIPQALPPVLPGLEEALEFGKPFFRDLRGGYALTRLAAVVGAREIVRNDEQAIEKLAQCTGFEFKTGSRETTFQTNIRTNSSVQPGLELNRLCRWATGILFVVQVSPTQGVQVQQPLGSGPRHVLQTSIDINTHPDTAPDGSKADEILDELLAHVTAIMERGYGAL